MATSKSLTCWQNVPVPTIDGIGMLKQQTLAIAWDQGKRFEQHRQSTRRDVCLSTMEQIMPWPAPCTVIEPRCLKTGGDRPPVGLKWILRRSSAWPWLELADGACEEALLDNTALPRSGKRVLGNSPHLLLDEAC